MLEGRRSTVMAYEGVLPSPRYLPTRCIVNNRPPQGMGYMIATHLELYTSYVPPARNVCWMTIARFTHGYLMFSPCWGGAELGGRVVAPCMGQSYSFTCFIVYLYWFWDAFKIIYGWYLHVIGHNIQIMMLKLIYTVASLIRSTIPNSLIK